MLEYKRPQLFVVLKNVQDFEKFAIVLGRVHQLFKNHLFFLTGQLFAAAHPLGATSAGGVFLLAHVVTIRVILFVVIVLITISTVGGNLLLQSGLVNHVLDCDRRWLITALRRWLDRTLFIEIIIHGPLLLVG